MSNYKLDIFHSNKEFEQVTVESSFSLRDGGGDRIMCCMISDDDGAVAFITNQSLAKKICNLLNASKDVE